MRLRAFQCNVLSRNTSNVEIYVADSFLREQKLMLKNHFTVVEDSATQIALSDCVKKNIFHRILLLEQCKDKKA